jgi:PAT family beta-lactamase induction signal transducer AmpG
MISLCTIAALFSFPSDAASSASEESIFVFTAFVFLLNVFSGINDVATDALAVDILPHGERGFVTGMMFGAMYLGTAAGGAGALFLDQYIGRTGCFAATTALMSSIAIVACLPCKETAPQFESRSCSALIEFSKQVFWSFFRDRATVLGLVVSLMPFGSTALSLSMISNLTVEFQFDANQMSLMNVLTQVIIAVMCIVGGVISDRLGRRLAACIFTLGSCACTFTFAMFLWKYHYVFPREESTLEPVSAALVQAFWGCAMGYAVFQGLAMSATTAIFMDITSKATAATQFTAYMALSNVVYTYEAAWQGSAEMKLGYPTTLLIDAITGTFCLGVIPFIRPKQIEEIEDVEPNEPLIE